MPEEIILNARELSDLYALTTLYKYLKEDSSFKKILFTGHLNSPRSKEILKNVSTINYYSDVDFSVDTFSDVGHGQHGKTSVAIDVSILKNCAKPLTQKEKYALRRKYKIRSKKPIIVMSHTNETGYEQDIITNFNNKASIYIINGRGNKYGLKGNDLKKIKRITKHGVLKDYYSIADVALTGQNLINSQTNLHNFVEITEGGPWFMVPSTGSKQFGYKELVDAGSIVECTGPNQIVDQIHKYLEGNSQKDEIIKRRANHLNKTREQYLPIIKKLIAHTYGENYVEQVNEEALAKLCIKRISHQNTRKQVFIYHTETNWTTNHNTGVTSNGLYDEAFKDVIKNQDFKKIINECEQKYKSMTNTIMQTQQEIMKTLQNTLSI